MKTVGFISLGCPKNLVDSEVMLGLLEKAGYRIVQDPSEAEVLIVNTCSFIEDAKKESVDTILEMGEYKKRSQRSEVRCRKNQISDLRLPTASYGKCKKLVVAGCLPQRYKGELAKLLPEVDLFVGTGEYQNIVELLNGASPNLRASKYIHNARTPRKIATSRHAVYIKIAEGCFHDCSFCIIPKIRGKFRSRPINDIVKEAAALVKNGAKELNLIGQDTTSYGRDLKDGSDLSALLKKLSQIKGDFWIRIMYAYPTSITSELMEAIADLPKVCKYLDVPVQHISDRILSLMRRRERGTDIRRLIEELKKKIPKVTLRTSLIVGFPGETKKDFEELLSFVKEGCFDRLGVFTYSEEEGTGAAKLKGHVSQEIKRERQKRIMEAQKKISLAKNKKLIGSDMKAIIVGGDSEFIYARTQRQAPDIDGIVKIKAGAKVRMGEFSEIKIIKADEYDLTAYVIARV